MIFNLNTMNSGGADEIRTREKPACKAGAVATVPRPQICLYHLKLRI